MKTVKYDPKMKKRRSLLRETGAKNAIAAVLAVVAVVEDMVVVLADVVSKDMVTVVVGTKLVDVMVGVVTDEAEPTVGITLVVPTFTVMKQATMCVIAHFSANNLQSRNAAVHKFTSALS